MSDINKRRNFLNVLLGSSLATWLAAIGYPILAYLKPPKEREANLSAIKVDTLDNFPADSGRIIPFGRKPALVIRSDNGTTNESFSAFIATCTHLDCTVKYRNDMKAIFCACHNGVYDLNGKNIGGPPPRPLTPLQVNIRDGAIYVSRDVLT